jgi:hypothetical protein
MSRGAPPPIDFSLAQRWGRAIAMAQSGERHELARMVAYEGPPPAGFREAVFMLVENPAPVRREGRPNKIPDHLARLIRVAVQTAKHGDKGATLEQLEQEFGIDRRTINDIVAKRGAYKRRVWKLKPVAKR